MSDKTVAHSHSSRIRKMAFCAVFTALIAVGAFIKIPVPVVPFTLQLLFTTLAGMLLGAGGGAVSVLVYLIIGLAGVPVFTGGGGIGYVLQPTFGYLIGFCLGAALTGFIAGGGKPTFKRMLCSAFAGLAVVYFCGMVYCYLISNYVIDSPIALKPLFIYCFVLAVPGDIALCIIASVIAKRIVPALKGMV
ncbi:MAG: biotin transporter BioY [bacterium]|nr:biotin transporter BioY [bacterium]